MMREKIDLLNLELVDLQLATCSHAFNLINSAL